MSSVLETGLYSDEKKASEKYFIKRSKKVDKLFSFSYNKHNGNGVTVVFL